MTHEDIAKIIKTTVLHAFRKYPDVEWDELESQAWLIITEDVEKYDAGKGAKLSTYLYSRLEGRLAHYAERNLLKHLNMNGMRYHGESTHELSVEGPEKLYEVLQEAESLATQHGGTTAKIIELMMDGYTQSEAAEALGISRQAVEQSLRKVRKAHE